jgi:hypothetical protein
VDVIAITTMGTKIGIATVILGVTSVEEEKEAALVGCPTSEEERERKEKRRLCNICCNSKR